MAMAPKYNIGKATSFRLFVVYKRFGILKCTFTAVTYPCAMLSIIFKMTDLPQRACFSVECSFTLHFAILKRSLCFQGAILEIVCQRVAGLFPYDLAIGVISFHWHS